MKLLKKLLQILLHRVVLVALALLFQISIIVVMILKFNNYFVYFYVICILISILVSLYVLNSKINPSYKMAWIIPILLFPIFGGDYFILFSVEKN